MKEDNIRNFGVVRKMSRVISPKSAVFHHSHLSKDMPVYQLSPHDFKSIHPPSFLSDFITSEQWATMRIVIVNKEEESQNVAVMAECIICCICLFPCIFLCHPCIQRIAAERYNSAKEINQSAFGGRPVVSALPDHFCINTELLPPMTTPTMASSVIPVAEVVSSQPLMSSANAPMKNEAHGGTVPPTAPPVVVTAQPTIVRQIKVIVPENTPAGSTIQVSTPDGRLVQVVVPQGVHPGQEIVVAY